MVFLFTTGCRVGAALKITWDMVSNDCTKLTLPGSIVKNKKPIVLALPAELSTALQKQVRKQFRQVGKPVFDGTNLRREWHKATRAAKCSNLIIHDLRRSGARNLREAGVDETVIMNIGGWKTRSVFIRYGIVATGDIEKAMAVLQKKTGTLLKNDGTSMEPASQIAQR